MMVTANAVILHERPNPSTAYFVEPYLVDSMKPTRVFEFGDDLPPASLEGATVVIVRYLSPRWKSAIASSRSTLAGLAYFFDDDLFDPSAWRGLPIRYRWKLWRHAMRHRDWLQAMGASLWTANSYLAEKYGQCGFGTTAVIPLRQPLSDRDAAPSDPAEAIFFYHGSASHATEARWLLPIVEEVLRRCPEASFEIIASGEVARAYASKHRVRVVSPMSWPDYQMFCRSRRRAVGLAPVLAGRFNQARSPVKVLDIARAGGVGVFSAHTLFDACVDDGTEGLLLRNEPAIWVDSIVRLLRDTDMRLAMRDAQQKRIGRDFGPGR